MSLHQMMMFILYLNSSIKRYSLYLLPLIVFLNFCTNSYIIFSSYFILFSFATSTVSLSLPPNFFFISAKNSPTIFYSNISPSKSSKIISFHTSANSPCIYDKIHWICSSTTTSLIFILIYNLHAIIKPEIFPGVPSNTCSLATSVLAPSSPPVSCTTSKAWICACSVTSCSCCCWAKSS